MPIDDASTRRRTHIWEGNRTWHAWELRSPNATRVAVARSPLRSKYLLSGVRCPIPKCSVSSAKPAGERAHGPPAPTERPATLREKTGTKTTSTWSATSSRRFRKLSGVFAKSFGPGRRTHSS